MKTFKQYINEGIDITPTEYGVDENFTDRRWRKQTSSVLDNYYTFFIHNDRAYEVIISFIEPTEGELSFGYFNEIPSKEEISTNNFKSSSSINPINTKNVMSLFGKVMYTALNGAKEKGIKFLEFTGANKSLVYFYKALVSNKSFINKIKSLGWELVSDPHSLNHVFQRIEG